MYYDMLKISSEISTIIHHGHIYLLLFFSIPQIVLRSTGGIRIIGARFLRFPFVRVSRFPKPRRKNTSGIPYCKGTPCIIVCISKLGSNHVNKSVPTIPVFHVFPVWRKRGDNGCIYRYVITVIT